MTEAHLTVEEGPAAGSVFVVREGTPAVLGRGPGAELVLRDPAAAPRHLGLLVAEGALALHDLAGGARLNDAPLPLRVATPARAGDLVTVGATALRVDLVGARRGPGRPQRSTARLADPGVPTADYELEGEIGRGASGKVYAARRRGDGRRVAIKLLVERVATADEARRFEREGRTLGRLKSPHVVELLERRVHDGRALLVMELVEGPSARDLVQAGPLPLARALAIAEDVARAVAAAAQLGIVHRDIKPGNVLVGPDGRAKLCDFGVAKDLDALRTTLTRTGQGLGTMAYLPPEQIDSARDVDSRADVYSLGATLYHLLAGRPPFLPATPEALQRVLVDPPAPLTALRPDCPQDVAAFVHAMLAKEPEGRPAPWSVPTELAALRARCAP